MQEDGYDTMQVCIHGHRINSLARGQPEFNKAFCPDCGEPTITTCPECATPIKGRYIARGFVTLPPPPPPVRPFCDACGMAYPWQVSRVAAAIELLRLEGIPEADVQDIERNLPDITRDTPRSQVAAKRVRLMLGKAGKPIYDVAIKIVADVASASVKPRLGL